MPRTRAEIGAELNTDNWFIGRDPDALAVRNGKTLSMTNREVEELYIHNAAKVARMKGLPEPPVRPSVYDPKPVTQTKEPGPLARIAAAEHDQPYNPPSDQESQSTSIEDTTHGSKIGDPDDLLATLCSYKDAKPRQCRVAYALGSGTSVDEVAVIVFAPKDHKDLRAEKLVFEHEFIYTQRTDTDSSTCHVFARGGYHRTLDDLSTTLKSVFPYSRRRTSEAFIPERVGYACQGELETGELRDIEEAMD